MLSVAKIAVGVYSWSVKQWLDLYIALHFSRYAEVVQRLHALPIHAVSGFGCGFGCGFDWLALLHHTQAQDLSEVREVLQNCWPCYCLLEGEWALKACPTYAAAVLVPSQA